MANSQTKATAKYQKKVGLINKGFKLRREDVEIFVESCEKAGVSQASQITKMMRLFGVDMDIQVYTRLKAYAERMNVLMKDVIDKSVTEYLDREEKK